MLGAVIRNTTNPTMLGAGYKVNVIPTEATAHVDGRFLPGYEDEFFATLAELCGEDVTVDFVSKQPPWEMPYDGALVDTMTRSLLAEDPEAVVAQLRDLVGARRAVHGVPDEEIDVRLDVTPELEAKVAAILAHRTEVERGAVPGLVAAAAPAARAALLSTEWFLRVSPGPAAVGPLP